MHVYDEDRPEVQFSFEEMPALPPGAMEDSDAQGQDEPICIEFDESIDKAERADYVAAAAIGASTGVLNIFWQKQFDLSEAHTWGKEKVESFVFNVAEGAGFKSDGKNLKDAVRFLEEMFPLASDKLTPRVRRWPPAPLERLCSPSLTRWPPYIDTRPVHRQGLRHRHQRRLRDIRPPRRCPHRKDFS